MRHTATSNYKPNPGTSQREDREAVEPVEPSKDVGPERRVYIGFRVSGFSTHAWVLGFSLGSLGFPRPPSSDSSIAVQPSQLRIRIPSRNSRTRTLMPGPWPWHLRRRETSRLLAGLGFHGFDCMNDGVSELVCDTADIFPACCNRFRPERRHWHRKVKDSAQQ